MIDFRNFWRVKNTIYRAVSLPSVCKCSMPSAAKALAQAPQIGEDQDAVGMFRGASGIQPSL